MLDGGGFVRGYPTVYTRFLIVYLTFQSLGNNILCQNKYFIDSHKHIQ